MSRRRYNRINEKEKEKILEMYNSGSWKVTELSEMFRVTTRRIYQIIEASEVNAEEQ
tara:strand:- start:141 stop:311 length:171 start_codon:yes stop_codon:yes gene_type:complete